MKLLSILFSIASICFACVGNWLFTFVCGVTSCWMYKLDTKSIRRKCTAIRMILRCDRFFIGTTTLTRSQFTNEIRYYCSRSLMDDYLQLHSDTVAQERAVESVKEIIEKHNGEWIKSNYG